MQMVALGDSSPHERGYRSPGQGGLHVGKADQAFRERSMVLDRDLPGTQRSTTRSEIHVQWISVQFLREGLDCSVEQWPETAGQQASLEDGKATLGGDPRYSQDDGALWPGSAASHFDELEGGYSAWA
ncbi:hypothetical protein AQJ58_35355 [Streptomyces sp. DSM 15324]|nr:hypothetical protein AQJ58_35355 [Streptomyces sp. DSM 15324]